MLVSLLATSFEFKCMLQSSAIHNFNLNTKNQILTINPKRTMLVDVTFGRQMEV